MAGLEELTDMVYHERQQPGSMLCAQHALNSLLQGNYFTAPDLAAVAHELDTLEQSTLDEESRRAASTNMDDTGFFSVQVVEHALETWGLNLVRWRSEQMRRYHERPYTQLAFILNLQQHWYTLRRFGPAETDVQRDPGIGHWYDLNSSSPKPEWIGRTYLGMVLQQAEDEGYSVFAVCQADPKAPLALARTDADLVAGTLDAPDAEQHFLNTLGPTAGTSVPKAEREATLTTAEAMDITGGDEDEDFALQAALQASLTGGEFDIDKLDAFTASSSTRDPMPAPPLRRAPQPPSDFDDPVAASLARNQAMLSQMQRAQEEALRENYHAEVEQRFNDPGAPSLLRRRTSGEIDEEEQMRRAIAASMEDMDDDAHIQVDDDDGDMEEKENVSRSRPTVQGSTSNQPYALPRPSVPDHRVYDDEDEELQAALRESLTTMPEGYVPPPSPPPILPQSRPHQPPPPITHTNEPPPLASTSSHVSIDDDGNDAPSELASLAPAEEKVDIDEMRRRRLARFGG